MLDTAGSFALLSMTLYMVGMAMITLLLWLWPETGTEKCNGTGDGYT